MDNFVTKDVCELKHKDVEEVKEDIKEIKNDVKSIVKPVTEASQWIKTHEEAHDKRSLSGWNIIMAAVAFGALIATVALGILKG